MTTTVRPRLLVLTGILLFGLGAAPVLAVDSGSDEVKSAGSTSSATEMVASQLADARIAIKAEDWAKSIRLLQRIVADGNANADVYNLLGYSLRKSGDMANALDNYLVALKLNPRHKGAHEYLGELYVETGNIPKANEHLQILAKLCGNTTCEEYEDLKKAIDAAS